MPKVIPKKVKDKVFELHNEGFSNSEIAKEIKLNPHTVGKIVNLFTKKISAEEEDTIIIHAVLKTLGNLKKGCCKNLEEGYCRQWHLVSKQKNLFN